jgi:excisionase family DNA binding protein
MNELYTLDEVGAMIKVGRRTLCNYIKDGKLKVVKFGKSWRVHGEVLKAFEALCPQFSNSGHRK